MRPAFLFLALFTLSSCASRTEAGYQKMLNTWIGQPVGQLVSIWGAPTRTYSVDESTDVLTYEISRAGTRYDTTTETTTTKATGYSGLLKTDATTTTKTRTSTPRTVYYSCTTNFTVVDGVVTAWSHRGDDCVAEE